MQCLGSPLQLEWWDTGSGCWAPLLWLWASLEFWHRPPLKFRRGLRALPSYGVTSSGSSQWGGYSLCLWHLGLLTSFHGVAPLQLLEACFELLQGPHLYLRQRAFSVSVMCCRAPLFVAGGSFLVMTQGSCRVVVGDLGFLSNWDR